MTGISVTPVVAFVGDLKNLVLTPNPAEVILLNNLIYFADGPCNQVEQVFTVPLSDLLEERLWVVQEYSTPVFTGGPHVIWGLTAFLLHKFLKDVILKCNINGSSTLVQ